MPAPVALLDTELQLQASSASWNQLVGTSAQAKPAFFDVFVQHADWQARLEQGLQGKASRGAAACLRRTDGVQHWVDWEVQPWQQEEGPIAGVLLCIADTTSQQRAEDRFHALSNTVDEGVLLMDRSGLFQMCNARAEEILGRSADHIVGSSVRDVKWRGLREDGSPLPNESFPFWVARYTGEPVRNRVMGIYPSEGPPRWIRVNAQPLLLDRSNDPYAVLASFADITEQKLSEEALRASKDMLSSVLASSLDGIMVFAAVRDEDTDAITDFEWLLANPKAGELIGHLASELMDQRLLDVMPGYREEGLFDDFVEVVETGQPLERELYYDHDDLTAWFQVMAVQLGDGIAVTLRDITERKEATQAMAATNAELEQRNQTLREFAYIASHDLQEPLRKISAFADLMREDYQEAVDETGEYYLERMQDAAGRMSTLINDLLAYSRVTTQTEPFESVDLNKVLDDVCSDLEIRIREVNGRVEAESLPTIEADPTQMRQLLQNLIGNALKFHRDDAPPVVKVSASLERTESSFEGGAPPLMCRLVVSDNGIGIEEKYADRIFTPFKRLYGRSQYEGTGMGLAICQRIAQRHGGRIELTSTPGPGSTFTVTLPATQDSSPDAGSLQASSANLDT
jgi:PAS domain S-box-containing protein